MANVRVSQVSFSRGEMSPPLHARIDIDQYSLGLKTLKNGFVHQEGCVSNRFGLEFVGEVKDPSKDTRLIPFTFNSEQTYIIEAGEYYFRFIYDGGYIVDDNGEIYEIETPYEANDLKRLKYTQSADVLTIVHLNYPPKELIRYDHNNWTLTDIAFQASIKPPGWVKATVKLNNTDNVRKYSYTITSVDENTLEESKRSVVMSFNMHREAYWTVSERVTLEWEQVEGACEYNIYRSLNGIYGYLGTATAEEGQFVDDNIEPDLTATAPIEQNPFEEGNNPSCCAYYQQRMIYANAVNNPQTLYSSQTAAFSNFNISRPLIATDAVTIALVDTEVNEIMHL